MNKLPYAIMKDVYESKADTYIEQTSFPVMLWNLEVIKTWCSNISFFLIKENTVYNVNE